MMRDVLSNYIIYLTDMIPEILMVSAVIAATVTVLSYLISMPIARLLLRLPRGVSAVIRAILVLLLLPAPTLVGVLVRRAAWSGTPVAAMVRMMTTYLHPITIASAMGAMVVSLPILVLLAAAGLRCVDPETILAARTLGMKNAVIRKRVILPQARGGIIAGIVLCCARALGEAAATAAALADPAVLEGDLVTVFTDRIRGGEYLMACGYIAVWLLAGVILLLLLRLCSRRRRGHAA